MKRRLYVYVLAVLAFALTACTPAQIRAAIVADKAAAGPVHYWACMNAQGQLYGFSGYDRDVPSPTCVRVPDTWRPVDAGRG